MSDNWTTLIAAALGALAVLSGQGLSWFTKRGDRRHERSTAYEARTWDIRSAALVNAVTVTIDLTDGLDSYGARNHTYASSKAKASLAEVRPVLTTYASKEVSDALKALRSTLVTTHIREDYYLAVDRLDQADIDLGGGLTHDAGVEDRVGLEQWVQAQTADPKEQIPAMRQQAAALAAACRRDLGVDED